MAPLDNYRWERFAQALAEGYCACEAYTRAGYKFNSGNCIRLKGNERVKARVAELQTQAAKASQVTTESLLHELEEARLQATDLKQFSAVVRSIESKARIAGLLTEKVEVTTTEDRFENATSLEEIARLIWIKDEEKLGLGEEDMEALVSLTLRWWEDADVILKAAKARVVSPPRMSAVERDRIERRRLGLRQRPLINGGAK